LGGYRGVVVGINYLVLSAEALFTSREALVDARDNLEQLQVTTCTTSTRGSPMFKIYKTALPFCGPSIHFYIKRTAYKVILSLFNIDKLLPKT
jgi:hypothetical protein